MKKRIVALLVLICVMFSVTSVFVHAEESSYEYYIKYLESLGLIDETFPEEYEYIANKIAVKKHIQNQMPRFMPYIIS